VCECANVWGGGRVVVRKLVVVHVGVFVDSSCEPTALRTVRCFQHRRFSCTSWQRAVNRQISPDIDNVQRGGAWVWLVVLERIGD